MLISTSIITLTAYNLSINFSSFDNHKVNEIDIVFDLDYNPGGNRKNLDNTSEIFSEYSYEEDQNLDQSYRYTWFEPKQEAFSIISELKNYDEKTVVIIPVFTHSAYTSPGFYQYFEQKCSEKCLTVKIEREQPPQYNSGKNAIQILKILNYSFISDIQIDKNPNILKKYNKIILLHNEYVTKKEFDAITSHPKVVYLYPNALHAEIKYDYEKDEIKLIRGHSFPDSSIDNGFNWEFDNTRPYEFDTECVNWEFDEIENGVMLNCYPEHIIWKDVKLLKFLKNY